MQSRDVGLVLPGVPQGECVPRGRQAVPLRLAQLDHDVGAGLVPALPVGMADARAPTRGAPTLLGSAAMYTKGTASRPPTAKGLVDIGVQENEICNRDVALTLRSAPADLKVGATRSAAFPAVRGL